MSDFNKNPFSASQVVTSIRTEEQTDLNRRSGGILKNLKAHQISVHRCNYTDQSRKWNIWS